MLEGSACCLEELIAPDAKVGNSSVTLVVFEGSTCNLEQLLAAEAKVRSVKGKCMKLWRTGSSRHKGWEHVRAAHALV